MEYNTSRSIDRLIDLHDSFYDFHNGECTEGVFRYFKDQQRYGFSDGHDTSIDYFHQYTYGDRGLHLIRIPEGSHELRVNLGTGEFIDDEDEKRVSRFDKFELRYIRPGNHYNYLTSWIDELL